MLTSFRGALLLLKNPATFLQSAASSTTTRAAAAHVSPVPFAASLMQQPDCLTAVAAFHRLFQCPVLRTPAIPAPDRCALRVNLIREELNELSDAIKANDLIEVADALADIQCVFANLAGGVCVCVCACVSGVLAPRLRLAFFLQGPSTQCPPPHHASRARGEPGASQRFELLQGTCSAARCWSSAWARRSHRCSTRCSAPT